MEEYSQDEDPYVMGSYDSDCEEEDQGWSDEEAAHDAPPWPGDEHPNPSYESKSEFDPEPPDYSQHNSHQRWYLEEDELQSEEADSRVNFGEEQDPSWSGGEDYDNNSWKGGIDSEICPREVYERDEDPWDDETRSESVFDEGENISWYEETESLNSLEETKSHGENSWSHEAETKESFGAGSEREEEDRPWCEIPYSDHEEENDSQYSREEIAEEEEDKCEAGRDDFWEDTPKDDETINTLGRDEYGDPQHIYFSGYHQGPEAYVRWEENLEYWFRSQNIPKEKRLSYALDSLVGEAQKWWEQEDFRTHLYSPINTWGLLKQRMYREFVPKSLNKSYTPKKLLFQAAPKVWSTTPKEPYSSKPKETSPPALKEKTESHTKIQAKEEKPKPQAVAHKQSPRPNLGPHVKLKQCKSSNSSKPKEIICYRCHQGGHFAANCPTRQLEKSTSSMSKPELNVIQTNLKNSSSRIMPLYMPKVVHTGHIMEQEAKEVVRSSTFEKHSETTLQLLVSDIYELIMYCKNIMLTRSLKHYVLSIYVPNIMHLIFAKRVGDNAGTKEELPDLEVETQVRGRAKPMTPPPIGQNRGVVQFFQLKGEPPDAPCNNKPPPHRGKALDSQRRMKANLLSLGADYIVSRSKHFQEGEYDEAIKSASTKEHEGDTTQTTKTLGENQPEHTKYLYVFNEAYQPNQCWNVTVALFFPYLGFFPMGLPRKVFNEATLSHQGITEKWNWFKIVSHEGDIQVTSQQPSNEPDGDQQLLIGDFRPNQKELSYKPNCYTFLIHQGSFSNWNQVNTNFGLGDINFLNRTSLRLPYLEAHGFRRLQTYLWRPGVFIIHLEAPKDTLICTIKQRIRRIPPLIHFPSLEPRLPYLSYLELFAFKLQQLFPHLFECVLETLQEHKRLPRTHHFLPKLSRYKKRLFPYLDRFSLNFHQCSNG